VLLVVGDGPERAGCETLARDLGLHNVRFLGAVSPLNVRPYYELADVYVHPAVTVARGRIRGDAWGFTINEAMAVGCPVVASTAVGAVDDLIRDGVTGRVVPAGDESALAQALLEMQAMPIERRAAMAESARAHLEAVASVDRQAAVFVEVVNTLTQSACVG
jgi:glycosyltransferase involved in cell wall biosynthesis